MEPHLKYISILGQGTECHCIIAWDSLPYLNKISEAFNQAGYFLIYIFLSLEAIVSEANNPAGSSHPFFLFIHILLVLRNKDGGNVCDEQHCNQSKLIQIVCPPTDIYIHTYLHGIGIVRWWREGLELYAKQTREPAHPFF